MAKKKAVIQATGFGVPMSSEQIDPPRFKVEIPRSSRPVVISEDFGIAGLKESDHFDPAYVTETTVTRCELPSRHWASIKKPLEAAFRPRLAEKGIDTLTAKWRSGEVNEVHRILGRELCVLAWAVEAVPEDDRQGLVGKAVTAWQGLRPEERWWLYAMAVGKSGLPCHKDVGWRQAIRVALTEGGTPVAYRTSLFDSY